MRNSVDEEIGILDTAGFTHTPSPIVPGSRTKKRRAFRTPSPAASSEGESALLLDNSGKGCKRSCRLLRQSTQDSLPFSFFFSFSDYRKRRESLRGFGIFKIGEFRSRENLGCEIRLRVFTISGELIYCDVMRIIYSEMGNSTRGNALEHSLSGTALLRTTSFVSEFADSGRVVDCRGSEHPRGFSHDLGSCLRQTFNSLVANGYPSILIPLSLENRE